LLAGEGGVGIDFLGVPEGDGAGEICPEGRAGLEGAVAKFDAVLAGEEAANAVVAVFDGGDAGPECRPSAHFAEVMGAFDDAPIVDEPAEEGEVPGGGISLEETGLGAIDGKDDGWWRHGTIVTPDGGFVFSDTRLGEIASPIGKAHMKHTLLLTLVAGALFGAGFAAKQVEKLQARMAAADGFLQADTTVEKDAALYPEKFKQKFSDPESLAALASLQKEIARLAPQWSFPDGPHDARIEGFARKGVDDWHPGGKVIKTVMDTAPWNIHKNSLGVPLNRTRRGFVMYKMPSDTLCRQQSFLYTEKFDGTGYQPSNGVRLNYARYLTCK
jgi:hypothetical protein